MKPESRGSRPEKPKDYQQDILDRYDGLPGNLILLRRILQRGPEVYDRVVPNLGKGDEIWLKFKDECGGDLDVLIEKYGR
ncbi:hypothetical protein HYW17_01690 [Candidatus Uhrbacteria bacterium]|nr:hypothetical protein [Candidatus Uhrbacteria bacterium]